MSNTIAFKIGDRYWYKFSGKKVLTTWSLAGAELVGNWETERIQLIEEELRASKKKFKKVYIGEVPGNEGGK